MNCLPLRTTSVFPYSCGEEEHFRLMVSTERHYTKLKILTLRNESQMKIMVLQEDKIALKGKESCGGILCQLLFGQSQDIVFIAQPAE